MENAIRIEKTLLLLGELEPIGIFEGFELRGPIHVRFTVGPKEYALVFCWCKVLVLGWNKHGTSIVEKLVSINRDLAEANEELEYAPGGQRAHSAAASFWNAEKERALREAE